MKKKEDGEAEQMRPESYREQPRGERRGCELCCWVIDFYSNQPNIRTRAGFYCGYKGMSFNPHQDNSRNAVSVRGICGEMQKETNDG